MEKKKVDIVILGNLICEQKLTGGGNLYPCIREELESFFDISEACIIEGDVCVNSFNAANKCIVVCGSIASKGGEL